MGAIHLFKMTTWQDAIGKWHCNDVQNLIGPSAKWYTPMRILEFSVEEYINLLVNKFNATGLKYYPETDYLAFHFNKESDARSFCVYINMKARKRNYRCK